MCFLRSLSRTIRQRNPASNQRKDSICVRDAEVAKLPVLLGWQLAALLCLAAPAEGKPGEVPYVPSPRSVAMSNHIVAGMVWVDVHD